MLPLPPINELILNRFWSKIDKKASKSCWTWLASKNNDGYGRFGIGKKVYQSHRLSYYLHYGDFDQTMLVLHKCDMPACVNPNHLFLGTNKENTADRVKKGRSCAGSRHARAKIKEDDVAAIKNLLASGLTLRHVASIYNVAASTVSNIKTGKSWIKAQQESAYNVIKAQER